MRDRRFGPSRPPKESCLIRFYNQLHEYYCGVDLHARSMYTPAALYPEGVSYQSPGSRFAHPGKRTTRVNIYPEGVG